MTKIEKTKYFQNISQFQFLNRKRLGKGSFGQVLLAIHIQTNQLYAIKIIQTQQIKTNIANQALQRQINYHIDINHPHIIKLWQVLTENNKIYMIMEYAQNGNLFYYQNRKMVLDQQQASVFFMQTMSAVNYLHKLNYLHRDLKPQNLLLDKNYNIKICDLGWIVQGINQTHNTFCGTYQYMAPEMLFDNQYDSKIDIWALGVLLYQMLHGFAPFQGEKVQDVRMSMMKGQINIDPQLSQHVQDLIFGILKVNPKQRYTFQQIKEHPWVIQMNKKRLQRQTSQSSLKYINNKQNQFDFNKLDSKLRQLNKLNISQPKKYEKIKQNNNKMLVLSKQKKKQKQNNRKLFTNLINSQPNITRSSKQKQKEKEKDKDKDRDRQKAAHIYKYLKQISKNKQNTRHRIQNSDVSQNTKDIRLKTEAGDSKGSKRSKIEYIRYGTQIGEGFSTLEGASNIKKRKVVRKKCDDPTNLIKAQKIKLSRKSTD